MTTNPPTQGIKTSTVFSLKPTPKIPGLPIIHTGTNLLADTSIVRPQELIAGLLHKGTKGVLASVSKAGKTWLLLYMALCIATGTKFLRWNTTQGKVLFINLEIQTAFMKERLQTLMNRLGLKDSGDLHFWNIRGKAADFEALVANIIKETEGKGYSLIVLDPIYKMMGGKSENGAGGVAVLCNHLERIAEKTGAAVVYSHHFAKGNPKKKTAIDRMSGSGVFARDADSIITLTEHTEPDCYTVEMILRNLAQQPSFVVQWEYPVMVERDDLDPEDFKQDEETTDTDEGLLELLKDKPLSTGEWLVLANEISVSRATFYRIKRDLKANGYIKFDAKPKTWGLVPKVEGKTGETRETGETAAGV